MPPPGPSYVRNDHSCKDRRESRCHPDADRWVLLSPTEISSCLLSVGIYVIRLLDVTALFRLAAYGYRPCADQNVFRWQVTVVYVYCILDCVIFPLLASLQLSYVQTIVKKYPSTWHNCLSSTVCSRVQILRNTAPLLRAIKLVRESSWCRREPCQGRGCTVEPQVFVTDEIPHLKSYSILDPICGLHSSSLDSLIAYGIGCQA